jgi:uncharacterized protein YbjT (DUF2867 family)
MTQTHPFLKSPTILVTGPTGKVGRRLIPILWRRGVNVRAASRSPITPRKGIEPVRFDWTDESTYEAARKGVDAIYLVTGSFPSPEHADYIGALLDGAAEAGVKRAVLLSVYGLDQAPPENPLRRIELAVESSGVPYTILRPGAFMQNFSEWHFIGAAKSIRERDEIATAGGDGQRILPQSRPSR